MKIGIVGKPNSGKSTLFSAITDKAVEIANYPFTTIKPNMGVCYLTVKCPCKELKVKCNARTKCENGVRFIPINVLDVAGLVPGASEGKGMGNEFLDHLKEASVLINVIDASGKTDEKGEPTSNYDPKKDVEFVREEVFNWFSAILSKHWYKYAKKIHMQSLKIEDFLSDKFSGLGITRELVTNTLRELSLESDPESWSENHFESFVRSLMRELKPMLHASNKMDCEGAEENFKALKEKFPNETIVPVSAESELALKKASEHGFIKYTPGSSTFEVVKGLNEAQKHGLELIKSRILDKYGSTGVQNVINTAVFDLLKLIVVYPVENETHFSDKEGNVLPDAILLPKGSTPVDLAYKIHTDIGKKYVKAIDARTNRALPKDYKLKNSDIIKIFIH